MGLPRIPKKYTPAAIADRYFSEQCARLGPITNPIAASLSDGSLRQRVVPNKKRQTRAQQKRLDARVTVEA